MLRASESPPGRYTNTQKCREVQKCPEGFPRDWRRSGLQVENHALKGAANAFVFVDSVVDHKKPYGARSWNSLSLGHKGTIIPVLRWKMLGHS